MKAAYKSAITGRARARVTRRAVLPALLVWMLVTGCFHHPPPPPAPVVKGPPPLPTSMTQVPSLPPLMPDPARPAVALGVAAATVTPPPVPRTHRTIRKKRPADGPVPGTPPATTAATAGPAPSGMAEGQGASGTVPGVQSASKPPELGQLSAGSGADTKERSSMLDQIHALELRLAGIKLPQSSDAEATATQIRLFLGKARQATQADDLDGARTLALKAKVLLDELSDL